MEEKYKNMLLNLAMSLENLTRSAAKSWQLTSFQDVTVVDDIEEFGNCDTDGLIEIRITKRRPAGELLSLPNIIDTIAHELAHTIEWNHSRDHKALTSAIKLWLRRNYIMQYEYKCRVCGEITTYECSMADSDNRPETLECDCGGECKKYIAPGNGFILKGFGWPGKDGGH